MTPAGFDADSGRLLWQVWAGSYLLEAARYLGVGLLLWGGVHVLLRRRLAHRVIAGWPRARDLRREIAYSLLSLAVFSGISLGLVALIWSGRFEVYRHPAQHGWLWFALSLPLMLVFHDAYFYWTHRLLHSRWLFRHVHGVHHRSRHPSPWAAYAFHPLEALINGLVTPLILWAVPVHGGVLLVFSLHQILRNAHGHLSIETLPRGFARHWLGRHFTTTTHHHLHHEGGQGNFGLWFTWWDRLCGTERPDYLARFEALTAGAVPVSNASLTLGPDARHTPW